MCPVMALRCRLGAIRFLNLEFEGWTVAGLLVNPINLVRFGGDG